MQIEQATFTSAQTQNLQGYHLVAKSKGIDEELARTISVWGPSHASLAASDRNASCLNVFPTGRDHFAFSRTVFGGPEYSKRGGLQIVTRFVVFRVDQLEGYDHDLIAVARMACAMGYLYLQNETPERLPSLSFPDSSVTSVIGESKLDVGDARLAHEVAGALTRNRQVAVVGSHDPESLIEELMRTTPPRQRLDLSFTTGLNPSVHRPFRLHFLSQIDDAFQRRLDDQGIARVHYAPAPVA